MAWVSSNFVRALGANQWQTDATAAVGIQPGIHDTQDNDLASGIDACLNKNGANTPTANLSMGGFVHSNVGSATLRSQYPSAGQVQDGFGSWAGTSGGTVNAQTLSPTPAIAAGVGGQRFSFIAGSGLTNTASTTINVSGLGNQTVYRPDGSILIPGDIQAGQVYTILNDGASRFILTSTSCPFNVYGGPTVGASGGMTVASVSSIRGEYILQLGRRLDFWLDFSCTLGGTASNIVTVDLPTIGGVASTFGATVANNSIVGTGYVFDSTTDISVHVSKHTSANQMRIIRYNGGVYPLASGVTFHIEGSTKIA